MYRKKIDTPTRMTKIKKTDKSADKDMEKLEPSFVASRM